MSIIVDVDHYAVLGLPSGDEGAMLSEKEIAQAYRAKALVMHPDKRQGDPNAYSNFLLLKSSYETLKDAAARKSLDARLKVKRGRTPMKRTRTTTSECQKHKNRPSSQISEQERIDRRELAELRGWFAKKFHSVGFL